MILESILKPIVGIFLQDAETRKIKEKGKREIARAKIDLRIATIKSKAEEVKTSASNDMTYDIQVLKNRGKSWIDEILILGFFLLIILHFVPSMQPYMAKGWLAMGYKKAPWWLEFGILGILVSTLGLMGVLRMFLSRGRIKKNGGNTDIQISSKD